MRRSKTVPGVAFGISTYLIWGSFPAFFGLLAFASATEVLAQRILWTLVVVLAVLILTRGRQEAKPTGWVNTARLRELRDIDAKTWGLAALASAAIAINWGTYIYGVTSEQVVQCALGYFINPLVTVAFGVLIFRERLSTPQWVALGLGAIAVVVLTIDYGRPPVIALALAFSFALYGLVKKVIRLDALRGLAAEGLAAAPFALAFVIVLLATGRSEFGSSPAHAGLLIAAGPVTMVPLLLFAVASQRVPLSTLGLLQYLTPGLQMIWGVAVVHESMPASRWAGFALIWIALLIFSVDALRRARRARQAVTATEVPAVVEGS